MTEAIIFWAFTAISVTAALGVVFNRSIIYSALLLILVFLSIAGIFVLNNADFLAIAQTIVYAVGMTIIVLFGIMFTGDRAMLDEPLTSVRKLVSLVLATFTFVLLIKTVQFPFSIQPASQSVIQTLMQSGSTKMLGELLFSQFVVPFELASVLLLVAMVGAIVLAKKTFADAGEMSSQQLSYSIDSGEPTKEANSALHAAASRGEVHLEEVTRS
ncbi:MAG: NADH-quinone oxidoreductase subunit J [Cyanobacteria bacterium]|nr:NADH-quinone oxidoreductase subunit J [Cyanobacteriota bacterium]